MFWRFGGYANISTLEQVLDKPDVTLEELLDESDLIQELKAQNAKLIDFLRDDGRLEKLLTYVTAPKTPQDSSAATSTSSAQSATEEKEEKYSTGGGFFSSRNRRSKSRDVESEYDKSERQRLKHAYVACEILSSEVYSIYETLLENTDPLREFWDYIKQDAPLDPTQAGYFTKVNEALLEKKTEDMIRFIRSLDNVVPDMMKHVDCPMVMDLLLKLISLEKDPEGQGIVDWLQQQNLIPMLLNYITADHPAATQTSAGDFLKAIITISANATGQDASVIGPNELTRQLVSDTCVNRLCTEMLKGGNPLTVGVGIVIEVIRKNNSDYDSENQSGPEPKSTDPIYLGNLLRIFSHHISDFMALILSRKHSVVTEDGPKVIDRKDLKVAWGESIEPLGFDRFKTCELMAELLHCSNMALLNEKGSESAIKLRDSEREKLKSQGKLAAAPLPHNQSQNEFGHSVDSSGFHHAEDFTPLGDSPEDIKRLEVQNVTEDEDFEKVAISEAEPDSSEPNDSTKDDADDLTKRMQEAQLDTKPEGTSTTSSSDDEPVNTPTSSASASSAAPQPSDVPAPLFAKKGATSGSDAQTKDGDGASTFSQTDTLVEPAEQGRDQPALPVIETEDDGSPVVGDLLKMMFVEHRVVPTILDFFFRFPWNNFLHNVVYDVVQQVFNGSMDRGYNRNLAIDLFETGRITGRIIQGQERSEKSQQERKMRLGYMGHLTLIAEEVVKFTERQPPEMLAPQVIDRIMDPDWIHYVEHTLTETRDRDNAILGGVRPDAAVGPRQAVLNAVNAAQGFGNTGSNALANAGLSGGGFDSMDLANAGNSQYGGGNLLSGFGSSDDEDEEELEEATEVLQGAEGEHQDDADQETSEQADTSTGNVPTIPAPLAIPPSRARRQLAARLAEKKRNAATASEGAAVSTVAATAGGAATAPASGAVDIPRRFGADGEDEHDDSAEHSSDDEIDDGEDDDDDGFRPAPLKRQTTREALERRPIDEGDDDDDIDEERSSSSATDGKSGRVSEQQRMLREWGLNDDVSRKEEEVEEESDSSDEDQPVEMGRKSWMMRRSSSQTSLGK